METKDIPNRVTITAMQERIAGVEYLTNLTMTVCIITMKNGYKVLGESACVDPAEFNKALGEQYAYEDAIRNLWPLEGYLLAERRYQQSQAA